MNLFDTYDLKLNYPQAKRISQLIQDHIDFSKLSVGDVLDLNQVVAQLEEIIMYEEGIKNA